ncbi:sulfotransferase domain-containing protein [Acidisoma cellulosilytica]|uniref:Sulfotransferase domain-containing protein n=1 Tax=Acidisoma cellulosilyticum TaxID=2802395 RepID=A0A963Z3M0_9PROT|nr:sulfotransferase domain-containing protein [Acidisoma cellulosilyticum]MCB8881979.1 sulfotransferase domain-containing protein [Acidisoma cellulosilyticum]
MGRIAWIASYPKSGSTWLRAFLHNYIADSATPYDINRLMDLSTGENAASRYHAFDPRPASRYSIRDVQAMRPRVHQAIADAHPGLVFVKTHNAQLVVEGVQLITKAVTGGAIYILRDPRDIVISYSRHLGLSLDRTIDFMNDPEAATGGKDSTVYVRLATWSGHVHFWTRQPHPTLLVLRYEDLLADPGTAFGSLIRFLGQTPTPERLARAVAHSDFAELRRQEQENGFVEQPAQSQDAFFRQGRSGAWRSILTPEQSARIERDHGTVMQRFGYL